MTDKQPAELLAEIELIDDPAVLRVLVRRYHLAVLKLVNENSAFSFAVNNGFDRWTERVNSVMAELRGGNATVEPRPN
jgi:hypothetical protein